MSEIGSRLSPDCDFAVIWYYDHEDGINKFSLRAFHDHVDVLDRGAKPEREQCAHQQGSASDSGCSNVLLKG